MRTLGIFLALLLTFGLLQAQRPVKKDVMLIFDKFPPPPVTSREAYAKLTCEESYGNLKCNADKLFANVNAALKEINDAFTAQAKTGNVPLPPGVSPDMARKMQDPEMKKKMKGMSKEEKMKMAMEMMGNGTAGAPVLEVDPPPVTAALEEWQKVYAGLQGEFQRGAAEQQEEIKIRQADAKLHSEVDDRERAEIAKLPQISSGEMSAPDPAQLKAVQLRAVDRHIALADKELARIRQQWAAGVARTKSRFTAFDQKLVAADYASASKNFSTLKVLADGQIMMLNDVSRLIQMSRSAYEDAGHWLALRAKIEKQ